MLQPIRVATILTLVVAASIAIILAFPDGTIIAWENGGLYFFTKEQLIHPWGAETVSLDSLTNEKYKQQVADSAIQDVSDTLHIDGEIVEDKLEVPPSDIIITKFKIAYPDSNNKPLVAFFRGLDEVRLKDALIRIVHYGDSQVEGDRISNVLRDKFQDNELFGGCGPGFLPVIDILQGRKSARISHSGNWHKIAIYEKNSWKPRHGDYSLLGSVFRYAPYPVTSAPQPKDGDIIKNDKDSLPEKKDSIPAKPDTIKKVEPDTAVVDKYTAWYEIRKSPYARSHERQFSRYKLIYGHNPEPVRLTITENDSVTHREILEKTNGVVKRTYPFTGNFNRLRFTFSGKNSPDIHGVMLDCNSGIAVDNVGMRGSAVTNFTAFSPSQLGKSIRDEKVKLIILQFGVNVVPNYKKGETRSYDFYEKMVYRQIMALKAAAPNVAILVVGVSDMAMKDGINYVSYPNVIKIRDAQKNAAFKAGVAFWDLYEAMGGDNSMVSWVRDGLAGKDYTHFSVKGAQLVGQMLYEALMEEYYRYKKVIEG